MHLCTRKNRDSLAATSRLIQRLTQGVLISLVIYVEVMEKDKVKSQRRKILQETAKFYKHTCVLVFNLQSIYKPTPAKLSLGGDLLLYLGLSSQGQTRQVHPKDMLTDKFVDLGYHRTTLPHPRRKDLLMMQTDCLMISTFNKTFWVSKILFNKFKRWNRIPRPSLQTPSPLCIM